jgi:RNA polymerase sigma-70 factor (ECF subfamily)
VPVDEAYGLADDGASALEQVELADDAGRLGVCLDQLDEKVSRVIRTAFFEGVTYEVLAQREETPLGTMKSWIRRGLLKLRSCLEQ